MADCIQTSETSGTIRGICPDCDRMIYRRVNPKNLEAVRGDLDITITLGAERIEDTAILSVNCDSGKGDRP